MTDYSYILPTDDRAAQALDGMHACVEEAARLRAEAAAELADEEG